jgi:hypothetical protein
METPPPKPVIKPKPKPEPVIELSLEEQAIADVSHNLKSLPVCPTHPRLGCRYISFHEFRHFA